MTVYSVTSLQSVHWHQTTLPSLRQQTSHSDKSVTFEIYDTVLFKRYFIVRSFVQVCHSQLTNLFYLSYFAYYLCVMNDVRLSHLNKDYLLNYLTCSVTFTLIHQSSVVDWGCWFKIIKNMWICKSTKILHSLQKLPADTEISKQASIFICHSVKNTQ